MEALMENTLAIAILILALPDDDEVAATESCAVRICLSLRRVDVGSGIIAEGCVP
jgi:hypothetical protein